MLSRDEMLCRYTRWGLKCQLECVTFVVFMLFLLCLTVGVTITDINAQ